ncbi:MAG: alpha/beta fold hydrolase [Deltaproteobacteria bacterium]
MKALTLLFLVGCASSPPPEEPKIAIKKHPPLMGKVLRRVERRIPSEDGVEVFVVSIASLEPKRGAIVFTHGAGSAGSATWDLDVDDYSMMRRLARAGFDTYAVDMRGYGGSTMPAAMNAPADKNAPVSRAADVQPDLSAAIQLAKRESGVERVMLFGWSWGCVVASLYASQHPDDVERLLLFAPVYDRRWPKRHITDRAWRTEKRQLFFDYHDPKREDRRVLEAHVDALFRFTKGDALRLPNGPYRDLYGEDAPVYDAKKIRAHTWIVRGENDRASLDAHAHRLFEHLENAASKRYVVLGGTGHFTFRTHAYRALQDVAVELFSSK